MGTDRYILKDKVPVQCEDLHEWGTWMEDMSNRRVEKTIVDPYEVSTVFLGIDHSFGQGGKPILFETMIFNREIDAWIDVFCERYSTWDEAIRGHAVAVNLAKQMSKEAH